MISGYLGNSSGFDNANREFCPAYADQNDRDYQALLKAIRDVRVGAGNTDWGWFEAGPTLRSNGVNLNASLIQLQLYVDHDLCHHRAHVLLPAGDRAVNIKSGSANG